ncbi:MAG: tetratricopeptide repeat protein [Methanospirillaceae archaeon]|nr:tetratricopeptide repeat protein [Methanospirillaceae archaeon]
MRSRIQDILIRQVNRTLQKKDYIGCAGKLEKIIRNDPTNIQVLNLPGICHGLCGNHEKARDCYQQIVWIQPDVALHYNNLGLSYQNLGCHETAVTLFDKALSLDPDLFEARYNRANTCLCIGRVTEAIDEYLLILDRNKGHPLTLLNLGNAYGILGLHTDAIASYEKALDAKPGYTDAVYNIGHSYELMEQYGDALEWYEKTLELDKEYIAAWRQKAKIHRSFGEVCKAEEAESILALLSDS